MQHRPRGPTTWRTAALTLAVAAMTGCNPLAQVPPVEVARPAYVAEVRTSVPEALAFTGEVSATQRAELAFPVSGRVTQVLVEPGDIVRQGQVLARLDILPLKAQLTTASADLQRAEAQLSETRQRLERLRVAQSAAAISQAEAGAMHVELATAEAAVRSAQAQRDSATWSLEQATLRAPFDGVVAARHLEPGQTAGPGLPVIVIDGGGRELALTVPASLPLKPGQSVSLNDGANERISRVLRIAGRLDAGGVRKVVLALPDSAAVGSTWSATLATPAAGSTLWVPLRAVQPGTAANTGSVLRVAKDGHSTEQATLRLGGVRGDWIEVRDGLVTGDRVVVVGAAAIKPGTAIKPVAMAGLETRP